MDNRALSQVLSEIADLLEIRGDNAFKIRAYRTAAETLATWPQAIVQLDEQSLRAIPGIGKDLAARIRELAETGTSSLRSSPRTRRNSSSIRSAPSA